MEDRDNIYFAAKEAKDVASTCLERSQSFYNIMNSNAYIDKIKNSWMAYHGSYSDNDGGGHQISFTGEQGELVQLPVNHFRNLAQHIYNMITANRPIMDARAINTDYKSLAQTYLANGILDYYMREKNLEQALKKACEMSIVLGSAFVKLEWNATAGEIHDVDPDTNEFNYEGEIEFSNLSPLDVVFDGTKENFDHDWVLCRTFQNRYNLIAKYPELKDKINAIPDKIKGSTFRLGIFSNDETDDIPVYEFYHRRTEAIPDGRYLLFCDSDCIFLDTKLPYRQVPIFRIAPSDILGTPYGYTPMFDVFPIQEMINSTYSAISTNQNAFAVQNIFIQRGADISVSSLEGGMNIIEANSKPEAVNLTQTPEEVFKYLEVLIQTAETISGVNSVTRGNPEASLKSGAALALVQSMSLQFMSGLQQSYVKLIEDVGTALINILKDFANTPKMVALVGKNNRPLLKEFTGEQISAINRVVVDMGNPLSRTIAGRVQMAEQMMQMGIIKNPIDYFQVMNTGRLDTMFEGEQAELLLIKQENEQMLDGEGPIVSPLDSHRMHILEHKSVLADPDLRKNPILVKTVLDHIQKHVDSLRNTDPDLLQLCGEQPLPPPMSVQDQLMSGQGMQGAPGGQPQGGNVMQPPQGGPVQSGEQINTQNVDQGSQNLPNMPTVDAALLPSPGLQEQSVGNVK